ncbi:MAG: CRTAC1 family protein, partial [Planctomycetota bacterium]
MNQLVFSFTPRLTLMLVVASCLACNPSEPETAVTSPADPPVEAPVPPEAASPVTPADTVSVAPTDASGLLVEVTAQMGLPDDEAAWPDGEYFTPEITPGGVALFDFDQDGDLDIYQVCHGEPGPMPHAFSKPAPNRLFEQRDGQFVEVEAAAGLNDPGFGHGASIGDVDGDGDLDVFVTNFGPNVLYLNQGDGTFVQAQDSGTEGDDWSSASAFFDYDRDGDLDLMVVHFATFEVTKRCGSALDENEQDYCGPHLFQGLRDQLFRNDGEGKFTDVSDAVGITAPARGWGVLATDLTMDGWPDIYVCNDEEPNQLWVNQGDGTFLDEAVFRGAAFNGFGRVEASMGVALGDANGDGSLDLFMTHVTSETNTLYTLSDDIYTDFSSQAGTAAVDLPYTGWGCGFLDLDHDGDLDLAVANGRVAVGVVYPESNHGPFWDRYAEPNLLFLNSGDGTFVDVASDAGTFASRPEVTRGMAFGDLDQDGDVDIVTNDIANRLRVYRNDAPPAGHHWLQILARAGNRVDVGATIIVVCGDQPFVRPVLRSYSYLASNDPWTHFGLGPADQVDEILVQWSDGTREQFPGGT